MSKQKANIYDFSMFGASSGSDSGNHIQTLNNTVVYNYMNDTQGNLTLSYYSPYGLLSNTLSNGVDGIIQVNQVTALNVPRPRQKESVYGLFTTTASNGETNNSIIKFTPDLSHAENYNIDSFLGVGVDGLVYFINTGAETANLMTTYQGVNLPLSNIDYIAMDQDDGILFYNITGSTMISAFIFANNTTQDLVDMSSLTAWTNQIAGIYFNQVNHVLTITNSTGSIYQISIKPYDRSLGVQIPIGTIERYIFVPGGPEVITNLCINDETLVPYFVIRQGTNYKVVQLPPINTPNPSVVFENFVNLENGYFSICHGSSGLLYIYSNTSNMMKVITRGKDFEQSPDDVFSLPFGLKSLTRSPYGFIFP